MKRLFDVSAAILGVLVLSPVLLLIALLVRLKLGSPVLFRQERPGLRGRPFKMYKFRTMTNETDARGKLLPDTRRMTAFGALLRRTSLDEVPELINVLQGDMSLVGPRPLLSEYLDRYTPEQAKRHDVRPGITGWAQVNGRNRVGWEQRLAMDVWYVENRSFWLDLKIMALTVARVLKHEGISADGHVTMPKFEGSRGPLAVDQ